MNTEARTWLIANAIDSNHTLDWLWSNCRECGHSDRKGYKATPSFGLPRYRYDKCTLCDGSGYTPHVDATNIIQVEAWFFNHASLIHLILDDYGLAMTAVRQHVRSLESDYLARVYASTTIIAAAIIKQDQCK